MEHLGIREVAELTGIGCRHAPHVGAALRLSRAGPDGIRYRRYAAEDVEVLRRVPRCAQARGLTVPRRLARAHEPQRHGPALALRRDGQAGHDVRPRRLRKSTLIEVSARSSTRRWPTARRRSCFGAFQQRAFLPPRPSRYRRLASRRGRRRRSSSRTSRRPRIPDDGGPSSCRSCRTRARQRVGGRDRRAGVLGLPVGWEHPSVERRTRTASAASRPTGRSTRSRSRLRARAAALAAREVPTRSSATASIPAGRAPAGLRAPARR